MLSYYLKIIYHENVYPPRLVALLAALLFCNWSFGQVTTCFTIENSTDCEYQILETDASCSSLTNTYSGTVSANSVIYVQTNQPVCTHANHYQLYEFRVKDLGGYWHALGGCSGRTPGSWDCDNCSCSVGMSWLSTNRVVKITP